MATFLFDKTVFGPVHSRRLGLSLGINLLPNHRKLCNFDCVYCECGWNAKGGKKEALPGRGGVQKALELRLKEMKAAGQAPDVITFAGNGEPTMHPDFEGIVYDTVALRDALFPGCRISLLSNSTLIHKASVARAMRQIDQNILKLDTAIESTFTLLNKPAPGITAGSIIRSLAAFTGNKIIQTLFVKGRGSLRGLDTTSDAELEALIEAYRQIGPDEIMVYTFYRDTPSDELIKVTAPVLERIAARIEAAGFRVDKTLE
jgi:wyosine [tRNA(Phe)-imidazoG37] synthetase (radical SAM superfamily)